MADKTQVNDDKIKALLTAVETKRGNLGTRPKGERETNGLRERAFSTSVKRAEKLGTQN